jgi:hypothetical protein
MNIIGGINLPCQNPGIRNHASVTNPNDLLYAKTVTHFLNLSCDCGCVRGISFKDFYRYGAASLVAD